MIYEDFVTYEQAKQLKELGFDWECFGYFLYDDKVEISKYLKDYNTDWSTINLGYISAPTLSQTQKWLRETKGTEIIVRRLDEKIYDFVIYGEIADVTTDNRFDTYEQALSAGVDKALEIIENRYEFNK